MPIDTATWSKSLWALSMMVGRGPKTRTSDARSYGKTTPNVSNPQPSHGRIPIRPSVLLQIYTRCAGEPDLMSADAVTCDQIAAGLPTPVTSNPTDAMTITARAATMMRWRHVDRPAAMAKMTSPMNVSAHSARAMVIASASSARQAAASQNRRAVPRADTPVANNNGIMSERYPPNMTGLLNVEGTRTIPGALYHSLMNVSPANRGGVNSWRSPEAEVMGPAPPAARAQGPQTAHRTKKC